MNLSELGLPESKRRAIVSEFGTAAEAWINRFPALLGSLIDRFELEIDGVASAGLPINMIYFGRDRSNTSVVLKVGYPHPEQLTEMITMPLYEGILAPQVIDCSRSEGALLMERVHPGTTLREDAAGRARSDIVPELLTKLPFLAPRDIELPTYEEWLRSAFKAFRVQASQTHEFHHYIATAESLIELIGRKSPGGYLLHGDLHHENILKDDQIGWRAIDPKGVIGPRAMECGRFLHNFLKDEVDAGQGGTLDAFCEILDLRYKNFAREFQIDRELLSAVTFVDCVLSFCWTINTRKMSQDDFESFEELNTLEAVRAMLSV